MKRRVTPLLISTIVAALASACSGSDSPGPGQTSDGAADTATNADLGPAADGQASEVTIPRVDGASTDAPSGGGLRGAMTLNFPAKAGGCLKEAIVVNLPASASGPVVTATGASATLLHDQKVGALDGYIRCKLNGGALQATLSLFPDDQSLVISANLQLNKAVDSSLSYSGGTDIDSYGTMAGSVCKATALSLSATSTLFKLECPKLIGFEKKDECALAESYVYFEGCTAN